MFNLNASSPSARSPAMPAKYTDVDIGDYYDESVGEADFLPSVPSSPLCSLFPGSSGKNPLEDPFPEPLSAPLPIHEKSRSTGKRGSMTYATGPDNLLLTSPSVWSRGLTSPKFVPPSSQRRSLANRQMATMAEDEEEGDLEEQQRRYLQNFKFPSPNPPTPKTWVTPPPPTNIKPATTATTNGNSKKKYDKNNKPQLSLALSKPSFPHSKEGEKKRIMTDRVAEEAALASKGFRIRWKWVIAILFLLAVALFAAGFTRWMIGNPSSSGGSAKSHAA